MKGIAWINFVVVSKLHVGAFPLIVIYINFLYPQMSMMIASMGQRRKIAGLRGDSLKLIDKE